MKVRVECVDKYFISAERGWKLRFSAVSSVYCEANMDFVVVTTPQNAAGYEVGKMYDMEL